MGLYDDQPITFRELLAVIVHSVSLICLLLVIYLTFRRNSLVSFFAIANIGQHISKILRIIIFSFPMIKAPTWCCYLHAFVNYLTCGMESYIAMLFAMRLWLMITKKDRFKLWLLEHTKVLSNVMGIVIPTILAILTIAPQLLQGKKFVIPDGAQNCMAGYRQLPWQINLTGPGTLLPPTFLAIIFGIHIAIVICTVSTQNIVKDVKKFSTISYSSWIRMLWFGILFCVVVAINVGRDYKNAKNLKEHGIPEPALYDIGVGYLVTAGLGVGVLLIFGTTVEAKKKISKLIKSSLGGITSSVFTKKSSNGQSQSRTYNNSFNTSVAGPDSSFTAIMVKSDSSDFGSNGLMSPLSPKSPKSIVSVNSFKNSSAKAKKPLDEIEASMEFTKFMKSVNKVVKDENESLEYNGYTRKLSHMTYDREYDLSVNTNFNGTPYSSTTSINNGSITPRMMIPIQKFSHQRMQSQQMQQLQQMQIHHQQSIPQMSAISDDNQTLINNNKSLDEESLLRNEEIDHSIIRVDSMNSFNNPNMNSFNNPNQNSNQNQNINYVRRGTYTEEIVYPPKLSFSVKMK